MLYKLSLPIVTLLLIGVGYTQQASSGPPSEASSALMPAYPNSTTGLENLMADMISLKKQKNTAALAPYLQSLVLPHADAWFTAAYGDTHCAEDHFAANDCLGPRMAATYATLSPVIPSSFDLTLKDLINESLTSFEAVNYTAPCAGPSRMIPSYHLIGDLTTTLTLSSTFSGMVQRHEPVYVAWSYSPSKETTLTFFVYAENAFRYIGMLHPYDPQAYKDKQHNAESSPPSDLSPRYLSNDQIEMKTLVDPEVAKRTVVLQIITDGDGKVKNAEYAKGPEEYKDLAIKKAMKTKYRPPLVFGRNVQFTTCVNVDVGH